MVFFRWRIEMLVRDVTPHEFTFSVNAGLKATSVRIIIVMPMRHNKHCR